MDKPRPALSLQTIVDNVPVGLVQIDEDFRYRWANPAFLKFIGYSLEELRARTLFEVTHPDDVAASLRASDDLRREGYELKHLEKRYLRKDGEIVWGRVRARRVPDPVSGGIELFTAIVDITELKKREAELLQAEKQTAAFFQASIDVMCVFDFEGVITALNPAGLELLGVKREEIIGKRINDFVHPDDLERTRSEIANVIRVGTTTRFENRARTREGYRVISWTGVADLSASAIYAVGRDVTQRRQEQAAMTYSAKMASLGEMAGGLAHEVNNPLAIMLGKLTGVRTMLKAKVPAIDSISEELLSIEKTGQRIVTIIRGLRAFSRNAERDPMLHVDLEAVCRETLTLCAERLKSRQIAMKCSCPTGLSVLGRPSQLSQVLMNLIGNAADAVTGAAEPRIDLNFARTENTITIEVRDNGPGVEARYLEKIFQPFFTTKEVGKGTGLGLSISQGIVEQHGGSLIYSREDGFTVFRIQLPAEP